MQVALDPAALGEGPDATGKRGARGLTVIDQAREVSSGEGLETGGSELTVIGQSWEASSAK